VTPGGNIAVVSAPHDPWADVQAIHAEAPIVTLGPQASYQYLRAPEHLAMVLARYRVATGLIGDALSVLEVGCGEGIGAGILAQHRELYAGIDTDTAAIAVANEQLARRARVDRRRMSFYDLDILQLLDEDAYDAVVSLDVIEHIPAEQEAAFMQAIVRGLTEDGICVIGTPNRAAEHLASPASRAGHINLYDHDRLVTMMRTYFKRVQSFGMQDTSLHLGHPEMRHYLVVVGIVPKRRERDG
jgi:2-polyprenyl-3-methyl-5-hydroxy-6-metoxy-1,4-benzoquinol methylase